MLSLTVRKRRSLFAVLGIFLAIPVFFQACSKKNSSNEGTQSGGSGELTSTDTQSATLRYPLRDDAKSLDPAIAYDQVSLKVMPLIMESLFQYSYLKTPIVLEPLLAESMPVVSKDGLTTTIKLKKGVLWHDDPAFPGGKGRELVAQDFVYAWKRLLHPDLQSPGSWIFEDKVAGYTQLKQSIASDKSKTPDQHISGEIPGFSALDSHTIQIKTLKPYPQLQFVLAMGFGAPIAKEIVDKYGQLGLGQRVIGTGPFQLREISRGSKITIDRFANYRKEVYPSEGDANAKKRGLLADAGKTLPFLDRIEFSIVKEDSPLWLQFNKGSLDISGIPKDSFDTAMSANSGLSPELTAKGVQLDISDRPVIWYLNFNAKDPLVGTNVNLRRAIVRAVDRDFMIKTFLNGRGTKGGSIVPPGIDGHTGKKEIVGDYNIAEAKEFLKRAGFPNGTNLPEIRLDLRGASTTTRQQGEYLKKALGEIGVKLNVVANTFPAYLEKEKTGNLQFFIGGWGADYPDPENFLQLLYSRNVAPGPNASNWQNPKFDEVYAKVAAMKPGKAKDKLIEEAEKIVFDDAIWSMLYYPQDYALYHSWVSNFRPNDLINNDLKYVRLDPDKRKKTLSEKF
jgi:oligopeptide transport system substrate-binding protein